MSTNLVPPPEQTLSGQWWGKYLEKANQLLSSTSRKQNGSNYQDIVDILAEIFSPNSSINNSDPHFLTFKNNAEKQKLNKSNNSEKYNQPFTPAELH